LYRGGGQRGIRLCPYTTSTSTGRYHPLWQWPWRGREIVKVTRDLQRLWQRRQLIERDALIY